MDHFQEDRVKQARSRSVADNGKRVAFVLLAAILTVILAACTTAPSFSAAPSASAPIPTSTPTETGFAEQRVNILLIGLDSSPEREQWSKFETSADVICLLTLDLGNRRADMVNIPRDTYVEIYQTEGKHKAKEAFSLGGGKDKNGFIHVMKTAEKALGDCIEILYYCAVDMPAFKTLVDQIGGVEYDVDVRIVMNGRVLETGMRRLNGQQVLDYCRARNVRDNKPTPTQGSNPTPTQTISRQQNILLEIFKQLKSSTKLADLPRIIQALQGRVYTNLSFEQMCVLAVFGSKLPDGNIGMHQIEGQLKNAYNANYLLIDQEKRAQLIHGIFGPNVKIETDKEHDRMYVLYDWAQLQGKAYITYVNRELEKDAQLTPGAQKITPENRAILQGKVNALQSTLNDGVAAVAGAGPGDKRYQTTAKTIDEAKDDLKATADGILIPLGIKISWHVQSDGDTDDQ